MRKLCARAHNFLLLISVAFSIASTCPIVVKSDGFPVTDILIPPDINRKLLASFTDPSPGYYETSEYMIGTVAIGIVLLESDGSIDPSTENWDSDRENEVISRIDDGLDVLVSYNPRGPFSFTISDVHFRVPTSYEPITRPSTDEALWISEAMTYLGYSGSYFTQVRDYINDLRNSRNTDWAFAIFVVDSNNDADGKFTDGRYAYAYLGGPFFVMTFDVGHIRGADPGVAEMDRVTAHETCHMFYATDEYNGVTEYSGYLNVPDVEGSGDLMDNMNFALSDGTIGQIGWRPFGSLEDPVNTVPDTYLVPYSPDPTTDPTPTYTGSVVDIPYPNNNPYGTGRDVTINTITNVQFRVDEGTWLDATPVDEAFDEALEDFTFTTPTLEEGTHTIETRGINSVNHAETSYASDTITVISTLTVHLESRQDNNASSNLGSINFDGSTYSLPNNVTKTAGTYSIEYNNAPGYGFDHWETTGGAIVSVAIDNPTNVTVSGDGTLRAVYSMGADLTVSSVIVQYDRAYFYANVSNGCHVYVNITNIGDAQAGPFNVTFSVTWMKEMIQEYSNRTLILGLPKDATITLHYQFTIEHTGNYNLTAMADPDFKIPEPNETNNTLWRIVEGKGAGDIISDDKVDYLDLFRLAKAYGSEISDTNWNPDADINCDGKADYLDLFLLAKNYGKIFTDP